MAHLYSSKVVVCGELVQVYTYKNGIVLNSESARSNYDKKDIGIKSAISLTRARNNLVRSINSNVTEFSKFLTLTVKENITDRYLFLKYFDNFRRNFKKEFGFSLKYVGVLEKQKRGAFHIHLVVFNDNFLEFNRLKKIWSKYGSIDIKIVDSTLHLGRYLAKYLTKENVSLNKKSYLSSRGLKKPLIKHFENSIHLDNCHYKSSYLLEDEINECYFFETNVTDFSKEVFGLDISILND